MNWRQICFLAAVFALVSCGRKPPPSVQRNSPTPASAASSEVPQLTSEPETKRTLNFEEIAEHVRKCVVVVSVFDETGHLNANGHGFFLSDDGKFVADRSIMAGGVNAVAKTATGAIYNVPGAVAYAAQNLVLLKADARRVPFVSINATAIRDVGESVGVVLSPIERAKSLVMDEKIAARFNDQAGDWFDVQPPLPKTSVGAPVINTRGEIVGIVSFRAENNSCVIRPAAPAANLLAQAVNVTASWQTPKLTTNGSPSPSASKSPPKVAQRGAKVVYAPSPRYPEQLKHGPFGVRGSGSYRITFDGSGRATNVQVLRSAGNVLLDNAAVSALHQWRCEGGHDWTLNVPITFQP